MTAIAPSCSGGDPAALGALIAAADRTIETLRRRVETARVQLVQLEAERREQLRAQAALGGMILELQGQVERERREAAAMVQAVATNAEEIVARILADARAEVQALHTALESLGSTPGHAPGRVLSFRAEAAERAVDAAERPGRVAGTDGPGSGGHVAVSS